MEPSIEYCSLAYLNMWLRDEQELIETLKTRDQDDRDKKLKALQRFAGFYRIARNLSLKDEFKDEIKGIERYCGVFVILNNISKEKVKEDVPAAVAEVSEKLGKVFKNQNFISAASKFLWLMFQSPVKIYDNQARQALCLKGRPDYSKYFERWKIEFDKKRVDIENACQKLSGDYLYAEPSKLAKEEYIKKISSEKWFHERVFDIYLWKKGGLT